MRTPETAGRGAARYLLETNRHLARALRFRARRWSQRHWTQADGLVVVDAALLERHRVSKRAYSATALQHFSACPYRFYLSAVLRLQARDVAEPVEDLTALQRGSLIHEVQFRALRALGREDALPVREANLARALSVLDDTLDTVASEYREELAPAIDRVWLDGIADVRKDLRQWMTRMTDDDWTPTNFELAFGLRHDGDRDQASRAEPVELSCGITLRGAIDLVETRAGALRATDHKTGRAPKRRRLVIGGGATLQPALYGLALERLFPGRTVAAGRLYFCTQRGDFAEEVVAVDDRMRDAVDEFANTIDRFIGGGFLPAAPDDNACDYCDYLAVCGPYVC
ncbi:MAG: PD-(D/E)XK nuclease family protein [Planctomycetota bacterium]|nr:MAG: PD-(D/E)XK nuclease family protein [Planctomycetota bacterium]